MASETASQPEHWQVKHTKQVTYAQIPANQAEGLSLAQELQQQSQTSRPVVFPGRRIAVVHRLEITKGTSKMKRLSIFPCVVLALLLAGSTKSNATSLIVNGDFGSPDVGGNWGDFASIGGVPGWSTNGNGIEIDDPAVFGGGSTASPGNGSGQSLEINYDFPEDVYQTVTGLTVGQKYILGWAYGDRPDSGDEEMQVFFGGSLVGGTPTGGTLVGTDYDHLNGSNPSVLWFQNYAIVTATSSSELLSFDGLDYPGYTNNGGPSYGNEIDNVTLINTPEPSTWLLLLSGLSLLGLVFAKQRQRVLQRPAAISI
jgi:hypothetical protein